MSKLSKTPSQAALNPKDHETWDGIDIEDRQFQKMNVLGNLMCGMAHDFNNILTAILSFAELAKGSDPHGSESHLQGVTKAANQGRDLVQQILLFGSQREQEPKPINLAVVMKEVLSLLCVSLPANIEIDSERAAQPSFVMADPIQIAQILMNLCLNGAHSMGTTGGVLEVSLLEVKMNRESMKDYPDLPPGQFVRLRVRDTGSGIPPQVIERIFDPFFTTKQLGEGTGMGLAVVQDIVTRHHGMISVDSVPGQGTIFDIYLPRIPEVFETQEIVKVPVAKGNECILFVDNERSICELARENLKHLGYTTVTQTSSREALDMFVKTPDQFDLVITDLSMPQMNGERLAQELLSIRPDIPIILCTGLNQAFADEHVKAIGVQGSLLKPFTESDVASTIRRVLDRAGEERSLRVIV
jgi:nitrogen-specific signal transduction histidine kinase/CheY-like chemotaxis protein